MDDETAERVWKRMQEFLEAHPELHDKFNTWMHTPEDLDDEDPEAAALFAKEFPEVHG